MNTTSSKTTKHRQSIRLKGYHYVQPGWYFVTICTHNQECIFGEVIDGEMRSNEYGRIVADEWLRTEHVRPNVILDSFIVMPNHTHAIIIIADAAPHSANAATRATHRVAPTMRAPIHRIGHARRTYGRGGASPLI